MLAHGGQHLFQFDAGGEAIAPGGFKNLDAVGVRYVVRDALAIFAGLPEEEMHCDGSPEAGMSHHVEQGVCVGEVQCGPYVRCVLFLPQSGGPNLNQP